MKTLSGILFPVILMLLLSHVAKAQLYEGSWYVTIRGGVVSSTLYNDDDFTNIGNKKEDSWFSTNDYELLGINTGFYGIFVGKAFNDYVAVETGIYRYILRQDYLRELGKASNTHSVEDRVHHTRLYYNRIPVQLRLSTDFSESNFVYATGGFSVGFLTHYTDKSVTTNNVLGRKVYEQLISNGHYYQTHYDQESGRKTYHEEGEVSGLYKKYSFSAIGGLGFDFEIAGPLRGQVMARAELDLLQIEDHQAKYIRPEGTEDFIWSGEVRHPQDNDDVRSVDFRDPTTPFSFGFAVGISYVF